MQADISRDALKDWNIVVIDDDPGSLDIIKILLEHYGATTRTAVNGEEGFGLVKSARPHFVISDLSMPLMDGWGLIDKLKEDPYTNSIPVIALTAHAMPGRREHAISRGFHYYLTKPITPSTFIHDLLALLTDIPELAEKAKRATAEIKKADD